MNQISPHSTESLLANVLWPGCFVPHLLRQPLQAKVQSNTCVRAVHVYVCYIVAFVQPLLILEEHGHMCHVCHMCHVLRWWLLLQRRVDDLVQALSWVHCPLIRHLPYVTLVIICCR